MRIRLFTDLRFTAYAEPTGVGKHIVQMVRGLADDRTCQVDALAACDQLGADGKIPENNALAYLPARRLPLSWKAAETLWTVTGLPSIDRWCEDADWIYCPKNDFVPSKRTRLAVTIHGAPELDPSMPQPRTFSACANRVRRRMAYRRIVDRAQMIFTVSEFLKCQIVDWFGADPGRVCVVGNGVEPEFFQVAKQPKRGDDELISRPFLLCVGGLNYLDGGDRVIETAGSSHAGGPR